MISRDIIQAIVDGAYTTAEIIRSVDAPDATTRKGLTRLVERRVLIRDRRGQYQLSEPIAVLISDPQHAAAVYILVR